MVIQPIIKGAGMAAKGVKNTAVGAKNVAQQGFNVAQKGWQGAQQAWNGQQAQNIREGAKRVGGAVGGKALAAGGVGLMAGLAVGKGAGNAQRAVFGAVPKTQGGWIIMLPIILAIVDFLIGKNGIPLDFLWNDPSLLTETITRIAVASPYWVFLLIYWVVRRPKTKDEWAFPAVMLLAGFLTIAFGGWNLWIFYHVIFAVATFVILLHGLDSSQPIDGKHWAFLLIFILDIFGLATFKSLYSIGTFGFTLPELFLNRILFPVWLFFYLALIRDSAFKTGFTIFLILFYGGYVGFTYVGTENIKLQDLGTGKETAKNAVVKVADNWRDALTQWVTGRIQYAITGKVEQNQYEPLGVYLENVQPSDPRYYADEKVIIWGTIKARTLDDPINIKVGCFVQEDIDKMYADKTDPDKKFSVFTLEEQDFACTFDETAVKRKILKTGGNTIRTFADFNFETLAYLKFYLINRERQRAMAREEQDPFEVFAIVDRSPIAVYTNGPAKIEMGTTTPLIGVTEDYIVEPSVDIKIGNREGWQGRINALKELVLFLPDGINFDSELSCNKKFLDYRLNICEAGKDPSTSNCCEIDSKSCMACTQSCEKFVKNECFEVCKGFTDAAEKSKCDNACIERDETCKEACESFFVEGNQEYKGYALNIEDVGYREESKDFDKGKTFRCRFRPKPEVLGNVPIAAKSFRVKARYNYTLEKSVSVSIDEIPKAEKLFVGPPLNLRVKDKDGKITAEGEILLEDKIIIVWDKSINDGSGRNDVVGYRVYRKDKLEEKWEVIANNIKAEGKKEYEYVDADEKVKNAISSGGFKFYYHVEAVDKDGRWEKSEKMLEISSGKVASIDIDAAKLKE